MTTATRNAEDILRKIQALVDKAHGGTTDEESAALLAKADQLMVKYSIESSVLLDPNRPDTARPIHNTEPELRTVTVMENPSEIDYVIMWGLEQMFRSVADHLFVRIGAMNNHEAKLVGYPVDLNFFEMFFLKLKMHMFGEMLATVDPEKDWVEVMVRFKNMGYTWKEVHYKLCKHPDYPHRESYWERRFGVQFTSKMKKYCEAHPETPRNKSSNPKNWQIDFVQGYTMKVRSRLREMRDATVRENPNLPDLLGGKKDIVQEKFYDHFPDQRPHPEDCQCTQCNPPRRNRKAVSRRSYSRAWNADAYGAGQASGSRADLTDKGPIG